MKVSFVHILILFFSYDISATPNPYKKSKLSKTEPFSSFIMTMKLVVRISWTRQTTYNGSAKTSSTFSRNVRYQTALDLKVAKPDQMKFGSTNQRVLGPKIWTSLPPPIKNAENLFACKRMIKAWNCISCKCNKWFGPGNYLKTVDLQIL